jgi:hypothetical protein
MREHPVVAKEVIGAEKLAVVVPREGRYPLATTEIRFCVILVPGGGVTGIANAVTTVA